MTLTTILRAQCDWADRAGRTRRGHVCETIDMNLFRPLRPATYDEFLEAGGDELGRSGRTAKMRSLRSSSALAVNVFDAWRGHALQPIAQALEQEGTFSELRFEQRLPHGLPSAPPHLDVVLYRGMAAPVGLECKFCEPYGLAKDHPPIDAKYFAGDRKRWSEVGLDRCQALAEAIGHDVRFQRLGAGQLLKHLLALARIAGAGERVSLVYLWFDDGSDEADTHRNEVQSLAARLDSSISFQPITYQAFIARLRAHTEPEAGYFDYLRDRYRLS